MEYKEVSTIELSNEFGLRQKKCWDFKTLPMLLKILIYYYPKEIISFKSKRFKTSIPRNWK